MVEGNSDEPRPRAAIDTNPLAPKQTRASFKVIRPQDHGVFVSKREFVLAHKGWVVSVITNSSLLPSTIKAYNAGRRPLSMGGRSPPLPLSGVRFAKTKGRTRKAEAAWTARSQTTPNAHRLRDRKPKQPGPRTPSKNSMPKLKHATKPSRVNNQTETDIEIWKTRDPPLCKMR